MGYFCATKYISTSISTAVFSRITWWENYFILPSGFHGCSFKLLGGLSGASRKGNTLHKPTRWVTPCTTSKQSLLYRWKWVKVLKGEKRVWGRSRRPIRAGFGTKGRFSNSFYFEQNVKQIVLQFTTIVVVGYLTLNVSTWKFHLQVYCTVQQQKTVPRLFFMNFISDVTLTCLTYYTYLGKRYASKKVYFSVFCNVYSLFYPFP